MTLAHKFREAVKSDDAPSRRESRLQNFPCVEPSALGLSTFSEGAARKRVRFNESLNVSFTRQRLCKLSERGEPLTALVSQNENGDAGTRDVQGDFVISRGPEVGASPADRQQDAVAMAEGSSQEGSQCSRRGGGGWQCPLPAHLDRALCLKHMQQMRFGGRISSKAAVRKTPKRTKTMTSNCLDVEGRAAASSEVTLDGNERATSLNDRRQRSQTSGRRFCSERRECSRGQQVDSVEVPMHGVEGDKEVVLQLEEVPRVGPESKNQKAEVLVDLEGLEEGAVGWQNGNLGGQQLAGAIEGTQLRRSVRLAKHRSPTARELLGITPRKVQDGSGCSPTKRRKVSIARDEPALNLTAPSAQVCKFAEVVCISDSSSDCLPLPSIDCVVGEWSAAEQDQREQDGATWKRMRLHGCAFYAALLEAVGGAAALQECEWGGILRHRWIGNKEEALLGIVPSRVGRGSHDQVQVSQAFRSRLDRPTGDT